MLPTVASKQMCSGNRGRRWLLITTIFMATALMLFDYKKVLSPSQRYKRPYPMPNSSGLAGNRPYCRRKCSDPHAHSYWIRSGSQSDKGPLICFDGQIVVNPNDTTTFSRGLNLVVINAKLGTVMDYRSFNTHDLIEACVDLVQYLSFNVPLRSQVLIANHEDMAMRLCPKAKELLQGFGSKLVKLIRQRDAWVFAGEKGSENAVGMEKLTTRAQQQQGNINEIDGCFTIPMSNKTIPVSYDFGMTLSMCGIQSCGYYEISTYISTSQKTPTVCVAGNYVVKGGIRGGSGFNFVVIDPLTKTATSVRHFDSSVRESSGIDLFLESITEDEIIVGLVHGDGSIRLQNSTRLLLSDFGASLVWELQNRSVMYFAGRKGLGRSPYQEVSHPVSPLPYPRPLERRLCLPIDLSVTDGAGGAAAKSRKQFCQKYQGYGRFCYQQYKSLRPPKGPPGAAAERIYELPIVVLAGFNHLALAAALSALVSVPGLQSGKVTVAYAGFFSREYRDIVKLFEFKALELPRVESTYELMEKALDKVWTDKKDAPYILVIEDEVVVAPGFLDYMQQALIAMVADVSIGAASAWNPNSFSHSAADGSAVYYVDQFIGVAFLLSKPFYLKFMKGWIAPCCAQRSWKASFSETTTTTEGFRFLIPEVARADFYRSTDAYLLSATNTLTALTKGNRKVLRSPARATVLSLSDYEQFVRRSFNRWLSLESIVPHLCIDSPGLADDRRPTLLLNTSQPLVIVYNQEHSGDYDGLFELCKCLRLGCMRSSSNILGTYKGLLRFSLHGQPVFALGSKSMYFLP